MEGHKHRVRALSGIGGDGHDAHAILAEGVPKVVSPIAEWIGSMVLEDFSLVYVRQGGAHASVTVFVRCGRSGGCLRLVHSTMVVIVGTVLVVIGNSIGEDGQC
jgi:hypothetical protein